MYPASFTLRSTALDDRGRVWFVSNGADIISGLFGIVFLFAASLSVDAEGGLCSRSIFISRRASCISEISFCYSAVASI